jgi:hypothetical protein
MNLFSQLLLVGGVGDTGGTQSAHAHATIGLKDGKLYFSDSGFSAQTSGGGTVSGITLDTGELDLSAIPLGSDVTITIVLADEIWNAGYRFPSDVYQAVAIAYYPAGTTTPPPAVFGSGNWPGEFLAPSFTEGGKKLVFIDKDDDRSNYEYSIAVNNPGGQRIVLDPKIKNGGQDGN